MDLVLSRQIIPVKSSISKFLSRMWRRLPCRGRTPGHQNSAPRLTLRFAWYRDQSIPVRVTAPVPLFALKANDSNGSTIAYICRCSGRWWLFAIQAGADQNNVTSRPSRASRYPLAPHLAPLSRSRDPVTINPEIRLRAMHGHHPTKVREGAAAVALTWRRL